MSEFPPCPKCKCAFTYADNNLIICPECFHEWDPKETAAETVETSQKVVDAHGTELHNGDTVMVIKDLPVKGAAKAVKAGTKVKNIKLVDGDHNIDCRIEGFGAIGLKSQFVKKV